MFYASGVLLGNWLQAPLALLFTVSLGLAVGAICWNRARPWLLALLLVLTGWTNLECRTVPVSPYDLRLLARQPAQIVTVRGILRGTPERRASLAGQDERTRTLARLEVVQWRRQGSGWQPARGRILVSTPGDLSENLFSGQRVQVDGVLAPPPGPLAEGLFDYRAYLRQHGIYFELKTGSSNDWRLLPPRAVRPFTDRLVSWAQATLARGLPRHDEPFRLLLSMTLGWRAGVTQEIYEPFMRSGTMHIFAISGLHIAFIAGILVALLRVLRIPRAGCGWVVIPFLWCYTAATGWQPSAIRSTIMMSVIIGGWALRRPSNLLNSLSAAAFLILLWEPRQMFGASFQLSFLVVLSIALLLPPIERVRDRLLQFDPLLPAECIPRWRHQMQTALRRLSVSAATSLAAWLGSMPLIACYFHLLSPVTLMANLVILPLSSLALASAMGSLLCGPWLPGVSVLFNHSAWFWMACMVRLSQWATLLPSAFLYVRRPSVLLFIVYYGLLLGILSGWFRVQARRRWGLALLGCAMACYAWQWQIARRTATLTAIPLNGGLCVHFHGPSFGPDLLVDTGNARSAGLVTKPFLRAQGLNHLPRLVLTHGDVRHIGGAGLIADLFSARQICVSPLRFRSAAYRRCIAAFDRSPRKVHRLAQGERFGPWTVLHPGAGARFSRADDGALVLVGAFYGRRVLLLSDLGRAGQEALLQSGENLRSDIVITGLPAKGEALCDGLLDAIRPRLIVVCDSEFPAWERASTQLRRRLERRKVPLIFTRSAGAVTIEFRASGWHLRSAAGTLLGTGDRIGVGAVVIDDKLTRVLDDRGGYENQEVSRRVNLCPAPEEGPQVRNGAEHRHRLNVGRTLPLQHPAHNHRLAGFDGHARGQFVGPVLRQVDVEGVLQLAA